MKLQDKKRINTILFFAGKSPNYTINRLKLVKLLWLADRIHLNKYGRMILFDKYCALEHGPIPSDTMNKSKVSIDNVYSVEGRKITAEDQFDEKYFSVSDLEVMKDVWDKYGRMNESALRSLSHKFPEWKRFEEDLDDETKPNSYPMEMDDFFENAIEETEYDYDIELSENAKEVFKNNSAFQKALG